MKKRSFVLLVIGIFALFSLNSFAETTNSGKSLKLSYGKTVIKFWTYNADLDEAIFLAHLPVIADKSVPVYFRMLEGEDFNTHVEGFDFKKLRGDQNLLRFTLKDIKSQTPYYIAFEFFILKECLDYRTLPETVPFSSYSGLSDDLMCYTQSSGSVQSLSRDVQDKALELVSLNPESANVISVLDGIIHYCADLPYTGPGSQTALDTLRNGFGLCYGKANLAAGLCRALGIPARTYTVHPTHAIVEMWIPEYGWIKSCATDGLFPWPDDRLMIPVWTADINDENVMAAEKDGVILYSGLENIPHSEYWWEPDFKYTTGIENHSLITGSTDSHGVLFEKAARLWRLFCDLQNEGIDQTSLFFTSLQTGDIQTGIYYADLAISEAIKAKAVGLGNRIYSDYAVKTANWLKTMAVEMFPGAFKWPVAQELPLDYLSESGYQAIEIGDGAAGIGTFFLEMYKSSGDPDDLKYAEGAAKYIAEHHLLDPEIDWLSGAAGVGCFYLDLWKTTRDIRYLEEAQKLGSWLLDRHREENGGYFWRHSPDIPRIYLGWAHGAAGIGAFFARLYKETGKYYYFSCAESAARWINSYLMEPSPGVYCWPRLTSDDIPNPSWSGGTVGIVRFFLELTECAGGEIYFNYALGGAEWLVSQAQDDGDGTFKWWSYSPDIETYALAYSYGSASIVHLLYEMSQRTGNEEYLYYARGGAKWLQREGEKVGEFTYRWPHIKDDIHPTGLFVGTAGIGNSFLLYHSYDGDERHLEYAKYAANWMVSVAEFPGDEEVNWINYVDEDKSDYGGKRHETGMYSGAAGIGLFFLNMSRVNFSKKTEIRR